MPKCFFTMRTLIIIAFTLLAGSSSLDANAQAAQQATSAEHRYYFSVTSTVTMAQEKQFTEAMRGIDPLMVVSIDRDLHMMRLLAQRAIDPHEVVQQAAQYRFSISPRQSAGEHAGTYIQQD